MIKYLKPNAENPSKEIIQLIFKLRCKVTDSKLNYKGLYDNFECEACGNEEETQKHVYECKKLSSMRDCKDEVPKYEKIFDGNLKDCIAVAKIFEKNIQLKEKLKET